METKRISEGVPPRSEGYRTRAQSPAGGRRKKKRMNTTPVLADVDFYPVIEPILEIIDAILWPAIAVVVAVGTIYCISLGVKISKADEQGSREKAKKDLIGAIVGFLLIFVLVLALKIAVPILENWVRSQM